MFHLISLQINELIWTRCTCTCIKKFDRACAGSPPLKCGFKGSHFSTKVGWDKEKLSRVFHLNGLQINALIWTCTCTWIKKFERAVPQFIFFTRVCPLIQIEKLKDKCRKKLKSHAPILFEWLNQLISAQWESCHFKVGAVLLPQNLP